MRDNIFWSLASAVPLWTAYQVSTFWLQANHIVPTVDWATHPIYCVVLLLLIPVWLSVHFFAIHRLIHWRPLYRSVHYLHHKNVNPGPWSGLAMHPIEHLLYFSAVILFWIIPSHPLHGLYLLQYLALGATLAHLGFERLVWTKGSRLDVGDYHHYLHHKYVTVNYGVDPVPIDKWAGSLYDGSDATREALKKRVREAARRTRLAG